MKATEVRDAEHESEMKMNNFLRSKGWEYTSSNPGSIWLWEKKLPDGRTVLANSRLAFSLQESFDCE